MGAVLHNLAILQNHDLVELLHCNEVVGDDESGFIRRYAGNGFVGQRC